MQRPGIKRSDIGHFHNLAQVHDRNAVADIADHGEVV
jgi:hypothetical protein